MAKELATTADVAEKKKLSPRTLEKWRVLGCGPPYLKLGGRVLYDLEDVENWIQSRRRTSTSDRGEAA